MARRQKVQLPEPITLDDLTFEFEPARWCYNSMYMRTTHCFKAPRPEFRLHARQHVTSYLDRPHTVTIKVCTCRVCDHEVLDRDFFMEAEWTVSMLKYRREQKERYQGARSYEARRKACMDACEGVDASELKPGLLRELLDA